MSLIVVYVQGDLKNNVLYNVISQNLGVILKISVKINKNLKYIDMTFSLLKIRNITSIMIHCKFFTFSISRLSKA